MMKSRNNHWKSIAATALLALSAVGAASAQTGVGNCQFVGNAWVGHPCPQPRPGPSMQSVSGDGETTFVTTPQGNFPHVPGDNPFTNPPGTNFLMNVDSNLYDSNGVEMPNTQPSRLGEDTYLLHDGPVLTKAIDKTSPSEDLDALIDALEADAAEGKLKQNNVVGALKILEGRNYKNRAYSGFPMLHYNGPNKIKTVTPLCNGGPCGPGDEVTGGNLDVNMIYWDQRIESDVAQIDPSPVANVPWTVTYHVRILSGGIEDFSPMQMHFDQAPPGGWSVPGPPFHASMDQTFFPMLEEGTEYTIKIKQTYGKHFNLIYTWGWRIHPPRVQVIENTNKMAASGEPGLGPKTLGQWEIDVFGPDPTHNKASREAAIAMIGDQAPAKRMWNILRVLRGNHPDADETSVDDYDSDDLLATVAALRAAFLDWSDRTKLPAGFTADPDADITLLFANNTLYGSRQGDSGEGSGQGPASFKGNCNGCVLDWTERGYTYKVRLYNADNFVHGYLNVDFGGSRGWENLFQDTDPTTALAEELHTEPTVIFGERTDIVNGQVVVTTPPENMLVDHVLLDNTINPAKQALRIDPVTGQPVITNDRLFPMNTGGTEEFLNESPRDPNDPVNGLPQLGSGCFFTFGRNYAWISGGGPWGPIHVPAVAADGTPGTHKVEITYNFEPSRRLKVYQFDPLHHDVAIYSLH